jgi:hypothetical protein
MVSSWYIPCGDCPHLKVESWPQERIAMRCTSPESPYAPIRRVLAVMPEFTKNPGKSTIRPRWCHEKTEKENKSWEKQ